MPLAGRQAVQTVLDQQMVSSWKQAEATVNELVRRWTEQDKAKRLSAASTAVDNLGANPDVGVNGETLTADDVVRIQDYLARKKPDVS